jgi:hypothetical protein
MQNTRELITQLLNCVILLLALKQIWDLISCRLTLSYFLILRNFPYTENGSNDIEASAITRKQAIKT